MAQGQCLMFQTFIDLLALLIVISLILAVVKHMSASTMSEAFKFPTSDSNFPTDACLGAVWGGHRPPCPPFGYATLTVRQYILRNRRNGYLILY